MAGSIQMSGSFVLPKQAFHRGNPTRLKHAYAVIRKTTQARRMGFGVQALGTGLASLSAYSDQRSSTMRTHNPSPLEASTKLELRLLVIAALLACLPLFAAVASAQDSNAQAAPSYTSPAAIDRAVEQFTGHSIGEIGGARMQADRRLRLAACNAPLQLSWHGQARSTVAVACPGPQSWRIFVATRAAPQAATDRSAPVVERGDPVTIMVRGNGFSVQHSGEAMEAGSRGDWIAIRTARDATPVRAQIERPGLAIVPVP